MCGRHTIHSYFGDLWTRIEGIVVDMLPGLILPTVGGILFLAAMACAVPNLEQEVIASATPSLESASTATNLITPTPTIFTSNDDSDSPAPTDNRGGSTLPSLPARPTVSPETPVTTVSITPTPAPIPTSKPPQPDDRYAIVVHTKDPVEQKWFLDALETQWFLDYTSNVDSIPAGYDKLIYIGSLPFPSAEKVRRIAQLAPGAVWYIVGEPNRRAGYSASEIVEQLHDLYEAVQRADPSALITSPSVLNWDFTCNGCVGYQSGHFWVDDFRREYLERYGEEPPVDIWALDAYPLDWFNFPTVDAQIPIEQISGLRTYLDAIPEHRNKPIWVTELSLHWGWDDRVFGEEGCNSASPTGTYQTAKVIEYLRTVFDWLEANSDAKQIERWFLYITYANIDQCRSDSYAGLTLFDGPEMGATLTEVGNFVRNRILHLSEK